MEISRAGGDFPNINDPRVTGADKRATGASADGVESASVHSQVRRLVAMVGGEGDGLHGQVGPNTLMVVVFDAGKEDRAVRADCELPGTRDVIRVETVRPEDPVAELARDEHGLPGIEW